MTLKNTKAKSLLACLVLIAASVFSSCASRPVAYGEPTAWDAGYYDDSGYDDDWYYDYYDYGFYDNSAWDDDFGLI